MKTNLIIEIGRVWIDPPDTMVDNAAKAMTHIDGELQLRLDEDLFFEAEVTLIELASELARWGGKGNLNYASSDEEAADLLVFQEKSDGLHLFSVWQKFEAHQPLASAQVRGEIVSFVREVKNRCRSELGIDITPWLPR